MNPTRWAIALIAAALCLSACGDSSDTPSLSFPIKTSELPTGQPPSTSAPKATAGPDGHSWQENGVWHYTPPDSTCVYNEAARTQALYRDFNTAEVLLMDSVNCAGSYYLFYPATQEAFGGLHDPDDPRLRLRLIDDKVTVLAGNDGCAWIEDRRQEDATGLPGGSFVALTSDCHNDINLWYVPDTGAIEMVAIN